MDMEVLQLLSNNARAVLEYDCCCTVAQIDCDQVIQFNIDINMYTLFYIMNYKIK